MDQIESHAHEDPLSPLALAALTDQHVAETVRLVSESDVVREAWAQGMKLSVLGWVYHVATAKLRDLDIGVQGGESFPPATFSVLLALTHVADISFLFFLQSDNGWRAFKVVRVAMPDRSRLGRTWATTTTRTEPFGLRGFYLEWHMYEYHNNKVLQVIVSCVPHDADLSRPVTGSKVGSVAGVSQAQEHPGQKRTRRA